jgi:hypothetical protein
VQRSRWPLLERRRRGLGEDLSASDRRRRRRRVDLRLLESSAAAAEATRAGLRRLLLLQLRTTLGKLEAQLPGSLAQGALAAPRVTGQRRHWRSGPSQDTSSFVSISIIYILNVPNLTDQIDGT